MPIYRYRSDGYYDGNLWNAISNIYRWNGSTWQKIKKIYRYKSTGYSDGKLWNLVFVGADVPQPTTPYSSLYVNTSTYGTVGSTTEFYSGDNVRLSRGAWTQSPTSYRLRIQTSNDPGAGYSSVSDVTYNSSSSPTAANTTSSTYTSYTITAFDALYPSYYIKGRVDATNADGTTPLETPAILIKMGFGLSGFSISSVTDRGATFSWTISGVPDASTYIYSQTLTIRKVSDGTVVKTITVTPGNNITSVSDSVNLSPQTSYYAKLVVTGFDSWFNTATPTQRTSDYNLFTTLAPAPQNTVAPTIGPLNNRGYLPVNTVLTSTTGTWNYVSASTTYLYNWYREDSVSGALTISGYGGNTRTYSGSDVGDYVFVTVKATNTDGNYGTGTSSGYTLDQEVVVGTITPSSVNEGQSSNFSFAISHYPTSYTINWGDGTSNYSSGTISSGTSTVNPSIAHTYSTGGTYTLTVTAQPGDKTNSTTVTVNAPISIGFNANGGTISSGPGNGSSSYTYTGFSGSTFTAPSATRTHYTLGITSGSTADWRYPASGGDPYYLTEGINYTFGGIGLETSRTYYAQWTANTYTVSYNYNGGTGATASNSAVYPNAVTLPSPDARTGYTFDGWYTATSGGTFVGNAGSLYYPTSNITLYAVWTGIQYTVTFNANGGTLSSGPGNGLTSYSYTGTYGSTFTVPSAIFSGYTFSTWRNPLSGGDPVFATPGTTYTIGGSITFYAIWTAANLTAPTITLVSPPSSPGGALTVYFSGGSGPYYQIWWQSTSNYSTVTGYDANGSSSPVIDTTGPSAGTWYVAVRSVSALTNTGSGPSSTISSWSTPVSFTVSSGIIAPSTPTNGGGTFTTGTNYVTNATFTSSSSGTTPITYYWSVYSSASSSGPWSFRNSGTLSSSSLSTTLSIPQQSWNRTTYGSWAQYNVYAQNGGGNSGTLTWII